jgi:hypothetical protein
MSLVRTKRPNDVWPRSSLRRYAPLIKSSHHKLQGALLPTLIAVCATWALAPGAALAGTLDQQQTDLGMGGTATIDSGETPAQTFTAGLSGGIDQVDLHLESHGPTTPLTVEIRNTSGGDPGATVLAAQSVPASSIPATASWVTFNFATPAPVTAGIQYAVLAYSSPVSMIQHYEWGYSGDVYAGGRFTFAGNPPSGPWTPGSTNDLAFKTYVAPPKAATGERAAALKKCKHKHSKKKRRKCRKKANLLPV